MKLYNSVNRLKRKIKFDWRHYRIFYARVMPPFRQMLPLGNTSGILVFITYYFIFSNSILYNKHFNNSSMHKSIINVMKRNIYYYLFVFVFSIWTTIFNTRSWDWKDHQMLFLWWDLIIVSKYAIPRMRSWFFFQKMPACALIGACAVNGSITVVGLKDRQIEQDQQINDLINRL